MELIRAAQDRQTAMDRLIPARMRAIEDDLSYGGHCIPMGFILAEEEIVDEDGEKRIRKFYVEYPEHSALVRWLFRRYHELLGNLPRLLHELEERRFVFPPFKGIDKDKIPHVALRQDSLGNFIIKTRQGLISLLTNQSYIGHYVFN